MNNAQFASLLWLLLAASSLTAAEPEELLVTTARTEKTVIPGASFKRPADFVMQRLKISNDAPDETARKDEILETLRRMANQAAKDKTIELSLLADYRTIVPLNLDVALLSLNRGSRADTSELVVCIKTKVVPGASNAAGLMARLKNFSSSFKPVGRSAADIFGQPEVTIVDPSQYREQVIGLYAADAKIVTAALGQDYRVVTKGIDRQLQWIRDGLLDVVLYIPYVYDVIPANVTSYSSQETTVAPARSN